MLNGMRDGIYQLSAIQLWPVNTVWEHNTSNTSATKI